jgi:hypothetical protein
MGNKIVKGSFIAVSRKPAKQSFILLKPARTSDSETVAKQIASCEGVRAVCMTSGTYAYVVAARNGREGDIRRTCRLVRKAAGNDSKVSVALNHYVYRPRKAIALR